MQDCHILNRINCILNICIINEYESFTQRIYRWLCWGSEQAQTALVRLAADESVTLNIWWINAEVQVSCLSLLIEQVCWGFTARGVLGPDTQKTHYIVWWQLAGMTSHSRTESVLCCLISRSWRWWEMLYMMCNGLCSVLLSETRSREAQSQPDQFV